MSSSINAYLYIYVCENELCPITRVFSNQSYCSGMSVCCLYVRVGRPRWGGYDWARYRSQTGNHQRWSLITHIDYLKTPKQLGLYAPAHPIPWSDKGTGKTGTLKCSRLAEVTQSIPNNVKCWQRGTSPQLCQGPRKGQEGERIIWDNNWIIYSYNPIRCLVLD